VIGRQLAGVFRLHERLNWAEALSASEQMLHKVQIADPPAVMRRYPHQLSGGMLQRAVIAMALASGPDLLLLDEPTTSLDVTVEAAVLELVAALRREFRSAVLLISHNLGVIARVCDRVAVMYAGEIVEEGTVEEVYEAPRHPYTVGLLGSLPVLGERRPTPGAAPDGAARARRLTPIPGHIPSPAMMPPGCTFAPRCPIARDACAERRPDLEPVSATQHSRCFFWSQVRKIEGEAIDRSSERRAEVVYTADREVGGAAALLDVQALRKFYSHRGWAWPGHHTKSVKAVNDVCLTLPKGKTLGIVGESGCGKTTLARCIAGLIEPTAGRLVFDGDALAGLVARRGRDVRRKLQMVFQNPDATLNPTTTVGSMLARSVQMLSGARGVAQHDRVLALLRAVKLDERYLHRLPRELSGGERQRLALARALAGDPSLVICDEPLSALDVSVQAVVLNLLSDLQSAGNISYLFISHDLSVVQYVSDWVAVVYLGQVVDIGPAAEMFTAPSHPYTEALLSAVPVPDPRRRPRTAGLPGTPPSAIDLPAGCPFHTRCPRQLGAICHEQMPPWRETAGGRRIRCHIPLEELRTAQSQNDGPQSRAE
jgi:peptide/nickel transport system ATP-binding protein